MVHRIGCLRKCLRFTCCTFRCLKYRKTHKPRIRDVQPESVLPLADLLERDLPRRPPMPGSIDSALPLFSLTALAYKLSAMPDLHSAGSSSERDTLTPSMQIGLSVQHPRGLLSPSTLQRSSLHTRVGHP